MLHVHEGRRWPAFPAGDNRLPENETICRGLGRAEIRRTGLKGARPISGVLKQIPCRYTKQGDLRLKIALFYKNMEGTPQLSNLLSESQNNIIQCITSVEISLIHYEI